MINFLQNLEKLSPHPQFVTYMPIGSNCELYLRCKTLRISSFIMHSDSYSISILTACNLKLFSIYYFIVKRNTCATVGLEYPHNPQSFTQRLFPFRSSKFYSNGDSIQHLNTYNHSCLFFFSFYFQALKIRELLLVICQSMFLTSCILVLTSTPFVYSCCHCI